MAVRTAAEGDRRDSASTVDGRLDGIIDGRAVGWAWAPEDPAARLEVVVYVDGHAVAGGVAEHHRPSLASAGIGDGGHAFAVDLPSALADRGHHEVRVLAGADRTPVPAAIAFAIRAQSGSRFAGTRFDAVDRQGAPAVPVPPAPAADGHARHPVPARPGPPARGLAGTWWAANQPRRDNAPTWILAGGCAAYFLLFLYLTRHFGFFQDEFEFIVDRRGWNADAFLAPHVQSLLALPVLVYKVLFVTVGLQTTWPYRVVVFALHIASVAGVYVLARRRAGAWFALVPAGLLLVLGAAYEDELWAMQMSFLASVAAGIWAFICLDRRDRRGDIAAAVLIAVALASSSMGLPFAAAVAAELAVSRWRQLWIVGAPVLLYLLWDMHYGTSAIVWDNVRHIPGYDVQIGAYGFAGLIGLSPLVYGTGGALLAIGVVMLAVAAGWLLRRAVREWPLPPRAVAGLAGALALWTATDLARYQYHQPYSSQYVYGSAVFILLTAIAFLRWRRIGVRAAAVLAVAGVVIASFGLGALRHYARDRDSVDARVRVAFGAAELAGAAGDPASYPDHRHLPYVTYGDDVTVVHDLGSFAFGQAQIEHEPPAYRQLGDSVLIGTERLALRRASRLPTGASCTRQRSHGGALELTIPPGGSFSVRPVAGGSVSVSLRRLSATFPATPRWTAPSGQASTVRLAHDVSSLPWHVRVAGPARIVSCPSA